MAFDLRLVIGLFFALVGVLLLAASFSANDVLGSGIPSNTIDFVSGLVMLAFSAAMLLLGYIWRKKT